MLHKLICHPDTPARAIQGVGATILGTDASSTTVAFSVAGRSSLLLPPECPPDRTDGLWRTTCFEVFLQAAGEDAYCEFNFSPSRAWAAYHFTRYREGMANLEPRFSPEILIADSNSEDENFFLSAEFDAGRHLGSPVAIGLSAVIEEIDGTKSYWALRHPPGAPDFHHLDCFAWQVPALA